MRTGFRKILRDLWGSKGRTLLVVFSIAAGVMALGMIQTSMGMMNDRMSASHVASQPLHVWLYLDGLVDAEMVAAIQRLPGIREVQPRATRTIRWRLSRDEEWRQANLIAIDDYEEQPLNRIELKAGSWPGSNSLAIEAVHQTPFGLPPMDETLYLDVGNRDRPMRIGGIVRDPLVASPPFEAYPSFFVTRTMMERLTGTADYGQLTFDLPVFSLEAADAAVDLVEEKLDTVGVNVAYRLTPGPERHWAQDQMDGVGLVLKVMAVASLFLSVILVVNTISAVIVQQIPQIGIMKTVGAVSRQIAPLYLSGVVVYGVLSLMVAVPLGTAAGKFLGGWMLGMLNVPAGSYGLQPGTFWLQGGAGLGVPLAAALWPVLRGVAISVRKALGVYGLGSGQYGKGRIDQLLGRIRGLPRMASLALRNTFRRAGRAALTETVLITSGAIFIMVMSTHYSFTETIAEIWRGLGFDALVVFQGPQRIEEVVPLMQSRPNVERVEMWTWLTGQAHADADDPEAASQRITLRGLPRDTEMFQPNLTAGRGLLEQDGHALLLNQKLAEDFGLGVGDPLDIDLPNGKTTQWTIVGLVMDITDNQETAYVQGDLLNRDLGILGRGYVAEIKAVDDSPAAQYSLVSDLRQYMESVGVDIGYARAATEDQEMAEAQFTVLTTVLMVVTVLMAVVGSIGLSGTLSINVIERRREIGVMRAVGASSADVARIFMGEGLLLGLLSWAIAVPLGLIAGGPFVKAIGDVIEFPGQYSLAVQGLWIWLAIVVALSLVASWLPAHRATQISVSESLAYE